MAVATNAKGALQVLAKCYISTVWGQINLKVLPEITDSKGANYSSETIQGRSNPLVNYSHSEPNNINTELTFIVTECQDIRDNIKYIAWIKSLVYPFGPSGGAPYAPPPISKFVCGRLFGEKGLCVVLKNYSIRYPTDVPWDLETYLPYKVTISCQWEVVYSCKMLPTATKIATLGAAWTCPPRRVDQPPE